MTNFQLTTNQKHYVNAAGMRVEMAKLGQHFVGVTEKGAICHFHETGVCIDVYGLIKLDDFDKSRYDIVGEFEGWLIKPEFSEGMEFIASDDDGLVFEFKDKPYLDDCYFAPADGEETSIFKRREDLEGQYIGDWRNSLTKRESWK